MQDLTVTLIQTELFWEDVPANLAITELNVGRIPRMRSNGLFGHRDL